MTWWSTSRTSSHQPSTRTFSPPVGTVAELKEHDFGIPLQFTNFREK